MPWHDATLFVQSIRSSSLFHGIRPDSFNFVKATRGENGIMSLLVSDDSWDQPPGVGKEDRREIPFPTQMPVMESHNTFLAILWNSPQYL